MKLSEAYQTLGCNENDSPEEVKKKYKTLMKEYHPDINKSPDATEKSKQITSAYNLIQNPDQAEPDFQGFGGGIGFDFQDLISNVIFQNFQNFSSEPRPFYKTYPHITHPITLTFQESILGTQHKISLQRHLKCDNCSGKGKITSLEKCSTCNGRGQQRTEKRQGNQIFIQQSPCMTCGGLGKKADNCTACKGDATIKGDSNFDVAIPGGVVHNTTLRLQNAGNFNPTKGRYDEAHLKITVQPDPEMKLEGINVVSKLDISLLEALEGTKKEIKTVNQPQEIEIPARTKHLDKITLKGQGVPNQGDHIVTLNLNYPDNLEMLIEVLK